MDEKDRKRKKGMVLWDGAGCCIVLLVWWKGNAEHVECNAHVGHDPEQDGAGKLLLVAMVPDAAGEPGRRELDDLLAFNLKQVIEGGERKAERGRGPGAACGRGHRKHNKYEHRHHDDARRKAGALNH